MQPVLPIGTDDGLKSVRCSEPVSRPARLIPPEILGRSLVATSTHVELVSVDAANRENYLIDL